MNEIQYSGKLGAYFRAPLYMITLFIIADVVLCFKDLGYGAIMSVAIIVYSLVVYLLYRYCNKRLNAEIMEFATHYARVQRHILNDMTVPYGLMDEDGKLFWLNTSMAELIGKDVLYNKSITSIFSEITRELLQRNDDEIFSEEIFFEDRHYIATMRRMDFGEDFQESSFLLLAANAGRIITISLDDVTELKQLQTDIENQRLVAGLVFIDNYEDIFESLESVTRSMLTAIIERKITDYFQEVTAIVRKMDRDKYFVVMQHQYLEQLEEDSFSLLEQIKTTKAGNGVDVTLSMGFGAGGATYQENADYARTAMDLALGRGGAQSVVKEGADISYYGVRGKEVERNTRVKARMKAQALREIMQARNEIMIMGHSMADVDAFGSAIGVYCAARHIGKKAHIVLNNTSSIRSMVAPFTTENGYPEDMILTSEQALEKATRRTLVVVVDTNRPSYTECPGLLDKTDAVVVFDHHRQGIEQIQGSMLSYIEPYASSASEMIAEILQYFDEKVELGNHEADCIYAGILIDTNNFMTKTGVRTFEAAAYLRRCGSEVTRVRKLLREDMNEYKARAEIIRNAEVYRNLFAISIFCPGEIDTPTVIGAKAANELLNIIGIKASFILTEYQGKVYVSSRSIDEIDVQSLMEKMGGGGHMNIAGAQVEGASAIEVKRQIQELLDELVDNAKKDKEA